MNRSSMPLRPALGIAAVVLWAVSTGVSPAECAGTAQEQADLILEGVIVATTPTNSVALVRRAGAPRARALHIGEEIQGFVLLEVTKRSARFRGRQGDLRLFLTGDQAEPGAPATPGTPPVEDGWIRRSIPRASAKERFSKEIPVILKETDVTPRVEDGEVTGLRVSRLPGGTLLSESGLLPGDVVVSINGEPLREVGSLWELVSRLLDKDEIRVVVRRKGEVLKLAYDFTN
jgi:type II secretion system protein C